MYAQHNFLTDAPILRILFYLFSLFVTHCSGTAPTINFTSIQKQGCRGLRISNTAMSSPYLNADFCDYISRRKFYFKKIAAFKIRNTSHLWRRKENRRFVRHRPVLAMFHAFTENFWRESDANYSPSTRKTLNSHLAQMAMVSNPQTSAKVFHLVAGMLTTRIRCPSVSTYTKMVNLLACTFFFTF